MDVETENHLHGIPNRFGGGRISRIQEDASPGLRDYVCFLLLDFVAADSDLGEAALARGLDVAGRWGWADRLAEMANRELKWKMKDLTRIRRDLSSILAAADAQPPASKPEGA